MAFGAAEAQRTTVRVPRGVSQEETSGRRWLCEAGFQVDLPAIGIGGAHCDRIQLRVRDSVPPDRPGATGHTPKPQVKVGEEVSKAQEVPQHGHFF